MLTLPELVARGLIAVLQAIPSLALPGTLYYLLYFSRFHKPHHIKRAAKLSITQFCSCNHTHYVSCL